eukprot:COSAG02_NODE_825_length_16730_cov_58.738260_1_plen_129_part_00
MAPLATVVCTCQAILPVGGYRMSAKGKAKQRKPIQCANEGCKFGASTRECHANKTGSGRWFKRATADWSDEQVAQWVCSVCTKLGSPNPAPRKKTASVGPPPAELSFGAQFQGSTRSSICSHPHSACS